MKLPSTAGRSQERPAASFNLCGGALAAICLAVLVAGRALAGGAGVGGARVYDSRRLDVNRWSCPFYNDGRFGIDLATGQGSAGGTWPQPLDNNYLFGGGFWFGSVGPSPSDTGALDTLVSYSYDPNSYRSEMTPTLAAYARSGPYDPADRVWRFPDDWPPAPRARFTIGRGTDSLVPVENTSNQDLWCAWSDAAPENHQPPGRPLYLDVFQSVYAWDYPLSEDVFFLVYRFRNSGSDTLRGCCAGLVVDPDIGAPGDDMVGFVLDGEVPGAGRVAGLGWCGDGDNVESGNGWEEGTPGAFGCQFLAGPRAAGEPVGLTAFKLFTRDIDPARDPTRYLMMAGYDYRTGNFLPWDTLDTDRADKRFVMACGPFDLAPGQVEQLVFAAIAAPYGGPGQRWEERGLDSLGPLARAARSARFVYEQGWLLPEPPATPGFTVLPGDNRVRIVWDDVAERTPDRYWQKVASDSANPGWDPMYRGLDFQGYAVYRSENGLDWGILSQYDRVDSLEFAWPPAGDSALADSLWLRATDAGIRYSVVDEDVTNGFQYHYAVTAYDWNFATTEWDTTRVPPVPVAWDTLVLRSGLRPVEAVPRWDAVNWIDPQVTVTTVLGDTAMPGLALTSNVVVPYDVTATPYRLRFLGPEYVGTSRTRYRYFVDNPADGALVVDTAEFTYTVGADFEQSVPVFNGQELSLAMTVDIPSRAYDTAYVVSGSYPPEKVRAASSVTQQALWAFRGADYRIVWAAQEGSGFLTAKVYDETHGGLEVPYAPFTTTGQGPQNANGWCFVDNAFRAPTDTLKTKSANIYICGGFVALNYNSETGRGDTLGAMISSIQVGDEWMVLGHKAEGTPPQYNVYEITPAPGYELVDTALGLNVKVVPNPYIVFDEWESNSENRALKFTHLPADCTVRIFTMAGELVAALEHHHDGRTPHENGGTEHWDCRSDYNILVAPGVYLYHVESDVGEYTGKFVIVY